MINGYANQGYAKQASDYKQQEILTATPAEILILLYEGAIRFLNLAKAGMEEGNVEKYHNNLLKAQRIIVEFMTSLDMEIGGEVSKNLYALYEYYYFRLVQANIKKDITMVEEVLSHLRDLKATWEEAIKIAAKELAVLEEETEVESQALSA